MTSAEMDVTGCRFAHFVVWRLTFFSYKERKETIGHKNLIIDNFVVYLYLKNERCLLGFLCKEMIIHLTYSDIINFMMYFKSQTAYQQNKNCTLTGFCPACV